MRDWQSQAYVKHYCKYHIEFVQSTMRRNSKRLCGERSYSYASDDSTQVQHCQHNRLSEGKVSYQDLSRTFADEAQLYRTALLGMRILRKYR